MSDIDIARARVAELKRLTDHIEALEAALRPFVVNAVMVDGRLRILCTANQVSIARAALKMEI